MEVHATASVEICKKQKLFDGEASCYSGDRISNLPDNILPYILSFLPTRHAVGSSVLSTRWKLLWTSIHNLDFCDSLVFSGSKSKNYLKRKTIFNGFVDRVLLLNDVPNIGKFSLTRKTCDAAHFTKWISHIMGRKVQELNISIKNCDLMHVKWNFTCESLRILKIDMEDHITISSLVCFTNIEVLHLTKIAFSCLESKNEINMSCPILKDCVICDCDWWKIDTVNISAPRLQTLTIQDGRGLYDLKNCEIKIHAENLKFLRFESDFSYQYSLFQPPSLEHVVIDIFCDEDAVHRVGSLLREISNVRVLSLSANCIEVSSTMHPCNYNLL